MFHVKQSQGNKENHNKRKQKERKKIMARKPMVTRSFEVTRVNVMMCNTESAEVSNKEFEVPRTYKDADKLLKVVKETAETKTDKVVTIVDKTELTKLFGMSEADFLKYAVELDPETRKALETEEAEETEAEEE